MSETHYIRKRDGMLVTIHKRTRTKVSYVTHPMLLVWDTTPKSFDKGFRLATADEVKNGGR